MSKPNVKTLTVPEIAIIAATRGPVGFERGRYLQTSSDRQNGKHVFRKKEAAVNQPYNVVL
jgi:hypothetical protein